MKRCRNYDSVYKYVKQGEYSKDDVSEGNLRWDKNGKEKELQAFLDTKHLTPTLNELLRESKSESPLFRYKPDLEETSQQQITCKGTEGQVYVYFWPCPHPENMGTIWLECIISGQKVKELSQQEQT